ncbi:LacI family DNA-binding transcriptional regulator [Compostibacter hankyongensis]|uniref:LacI family DNA-binding transcriptional regulator n=1 Tax=Compostibacter hankyongensis TaxID=1007089 RepID=A0ABP8G5S0_9BACT
MQKISLKDFAKMAGVSPTTVSFVLNGKAEQMRISKALAGKISALAEATGYVPNQIAVSLRTGKSRMIGLIVESISGHFFASLAQTVEAEAGRFGYKVIYCSTENDSQKGREMLRMFAHRQIDGYIITPAAGMEKDVRSLVNQQKPVVLLDSYFPDYSMPHVLVDNYTGVKKGITHLLKKGRRHIGYITVDLDLIQISQRESAYRQTLKDHGIRYNPQHVLRLPYPVCGETAIPEITRFIRSKPQLEALFFATNYLGVLGLESIAGLGLRLPDDLAMVCFDDHDLFRLYPPGITVIKQPVEAIATRAVQLLMQQLGEKGLSARNTQVQLPAKLVVRKSS